MEGTFEKRGRYETDNKMVRHGNEEKRRRDWWHVGQIKKVDETLEKSKKDG